MKKYRCPKCGGVFEGELSKCPQCGVELHYRNENKVNDVAVTEETEILFHSDDADVIHEGIDDEEEAKEFAKKNAQYGSFNNKLLPNPAFKFETADSYYDGNPFARFFLKLGCFLFAVVTGFIGLPWAVCWHYKYETKHTVVNGFRLKFDGKGIQLFGRYLLWVLLTILTVGVFIFWLLCSIAKWKAKHVRIDVDKLDI